MKTLLTKTKSSLRFILIIIAGWFTHAESLAQNEVAIGYPTTNPKAILRLRGDDGQGLLLPAMTTTQRNSMGLNNSSEKGMMVFDNQVNAVFYWSGTEWVQAGGIGGSGGNQTLTINGNVFTLSGSPASTVPFSFTAPTGGQVLMWNGAANRWEAVSAGNDLSGPYNSSTVVGVRGKSIPALPTTGTVRALMYDPSGAGTWQFQEISAGGGSVTNVTGAAPITVTNPTTTPIISLAAAGITNALLANDAVTSAKILDGTITGADIANTTITANKLAQSGAANNQILQWNGTNWVPVTLAGGGSVTNVATGTGLTGGPITTTGTISIAAGGVGTTELANNAVDATKLADNAVTSAKIADATITSADIAALTITSANIANTTITANKLAQSGATLNQVLQWNNTNWVPATLPAGGSVTNVATGAGLTGGPISTTGTIAIATGGVDNTMLADNSVTSAKITDGTIVNADIGGAAAIAGSKVVPAFGAQNISTTGTLSSGAATVTGLTVSGTTTTVNTVPYTWPATQGAASTVLTNNGTGTLTWAAAGGSGWGLTGNSGTNAFDNFVGTTDAQPLILKANNIEGIRIATDGGVSIAEDVLSNRKLVFYDITGNTHQFIGWGLNAATLRYQVDVPTTDHVFYAGTSPTTSNELMRIRGNGNVGIATPTPTERLDVAGNLRFSGALMPNNLPGTAGQVLTSAGPGVAPTWQPAGGGWGLTGNAGTVDGTNFIGTTDNIPLNFRVNNQRAGRIDPTAVASTFFGYQAGNVTTGTENTGFGFRSLLSNTTGNFNAAVGFRALVNNTTGSTNTAVGNSALASNTTASNNTAVGTQALSFNTGGFNSALGSGALLSNTTGVNNTGLGYYALVDNTTGSQNSAVGLFAGRTMTAGNANTTGSLNTFLGYASGPGTPTQLTNATAIGANATVSQSNSLVLGSISGVNGAGASTNIGIGISNPSNLLHVAGDVGGDGTVVTLEGHSGSATRGPGISLLRSKGTVAAPVAVADGDYLGGFSVSGRTASAYNLSSAIQFNVDGAVAGTSVPGRITFSTTLAGSSTFTERMRIDNAGNVGIGTSAPTHKLHVVHANTPGSDGLLLQNGAGTQNIAFYVTSATGNLALYENSIFIGQFAASNGTYSPVSDRRLKKNIHTMEEVLPRVNALNIRRYHFNKQSDNEPTNIGVIAQELKEYFPELVNYSSDNDRFSVDYAGMAPLAIKAIQEQQLIINTLKERVEQLESTIESEQHTNRELSSKLEVLVSDMQLIKQSIGLNNQAKKANKK